MRAIRGNSRRVGVLLAGNSNGQRRVLGLVRDGGRHDDSGIGVKESLSNTVVLQVEEDKQWKLGLDTSR